MSSKSINRSALLLGVLLSFQVLAVDAQQLKIESKNLPLRSVLKQIEEKSGYSFLYDESQINVEHRINIEVNGPLSQVLNQLEQLTYLKLQVSGKNILISKASLGVLSGRVVDENGQGIPLVTVHLKELNQYYFTDNHGFYKFQFPAHRLRLANLQFSMIGRQGTSITSVLNGTNNAIADMTLPTLSVGLEEIAVTPRTNRRLESNSSLYINREVIEQSGALSLNDLLSLIPGQKIAAPSLQQVQQANLRSATLGTNSFSNKDPFALNNSFGVALIMDGIALSNNANMQTLNAGIYGMGNSYVSGKISGLSGSDAATDNYTGDYTFGGTDLRQIATDNIESIEIAAGVPSVKYGDMTNGAIIINRIAGKTPLNFNVQLRDNATVYGISKGFDTRKFGAITVGGNFTRSFEDNRDKMKSYDRVGGNIMWSTFAGKEKAFTNTFSIDYGRNMDKVRRDSDDPTAAVMRFKSYNFSIGSRANYRIDRGFLSNIGLNVRYSETYQNTYKEQDVNGTYIIYSDATETGVHQGQYASGIYQAVTNIEGKPIDLTARLDLTGTFRTGDLLHQVNFGSFFNYSKNIGKGQIVDPSRPRNNTIAANADIRKERYYDVSRIHGQQQLGFYAEDLFTAKIAERDLNVRIGTRLDKFEKYLTFSPRTNINYAITPALTVGVAYGWASKAPALAQLYPGPVFYEIPLFQHTAFNGGSVDEANSLYLMYVDKFTPDNSKLKPSLSQQLEFSAAYEYKDFKWGVNVYHKRNYRDVVTVNSFEKIVLDKYNDNPDPNAEVPYIIKGTKQYRLSRFEFMNADDKRTQGIEFMLSTPKWMAIATSFNLRAGLTKSTYRPLQNMSTFTNNTDNPNRAESAIYPTQRRTTTVSNAAITSSTHIPKAKLLINFTTELNLMNKTNTDASDGIPIGYYTQDGTYYAIDNFDRNNVNYAHTLKPIEEINNQNQPAVYTNFHLNVSKEISKRLSLAFHVYNVFNYRPQYKRSDNSMIIPNGKPTYGAQLRLKL
jgi:outer membrane receptor protein involved in Fe transport